MKKCCNYENQSDRNCNWECNKDKHCGWDNIDDCEKYKMRAIKQQKEAQEFKEVAKGIEYKAKCLEEEAMVLERKVRELWQKSELLWKEYGQVNDEILSLLELANKNLERYIECKNHELKPCPPKPCHQDNCCWDCDCN